MKFKAIFASVVVAIIFTSISDTMAGGKKTFGGYGRSGANGYDGSAGQDGRNIEASADGDQAVFMLSGGDGEHGSYGYDGGDAYDCEQPSRPDRNLRAASGGDGGDGGDGGRGGDGGNITLFYKDISQLRKISVVSAGGRGGDGAEGGRGGRGCGCYRDNWSVRVCEDKRQKDGSLKNVCKNNSHSCESGDHGDRGRRGGRGRSGSDGTLYLIKDVGSWQADVLSESMPLASAANESFTLSENIFEAKSDAQRLLAPGSIVRSEYYEYAATEHARFTLRWDSPRATRDFAGVRLNLAKKDEQVVHEMEGVLVDYEQVGDRNKTLIIKNIVLRAEARATEFSINADGSNTRIVVSDHSNAGDLLRNSFQLQFYSKTLFGWKKRLDRELRGDEWQRVDNELVIKLGDLGINKKFLKKRKKIKVKLVLKRSLGRDFESIEFTDKLKV